ncbi:hypothetical protein [Roseimaritima sediminicola]|uniref:hypothetical protein n=1 Tax=Roseimaritima sediminicola TaxID=2662066 RepID=UPI00129827DB|nr:hypothetical protein [Roseimaritima sediminicola]
MQKIIKFFRRLSALLISVCLVPSGVPSAAAADELALQDVLQGIRFERERLSSGVFSFTGRESVRLSNGKDRMIEFHNAGAFSVADDAWFYQYQGHHEALANGKSTLEPIMWIKCLRSDMCMHMSTLPELPKLIITHPEETTFSGLGSGHYIFDPRCLGLVLINARKSHNFESALETFSQRLNRVGYVCEALGDGRYGLTYVSRNGPEQQFVDKTTYIVDANRGFGITDYSITQFATGPDGDELIPVEDYFATTPLNPDDEAELVRRALSENQPAMVRIDWRKIDSVWVPVAIESRLPCNDFDTDSEGNVLVESLDRYHHTFSGKLEWRFVSSNVPEKFFDYRYFNVPGRTKVFDFRKETRPFVGFAGQLNGADQNVRSPPRILLALVTLTAIASGVLIYVRRRRQVSP